MAERYQDRRYRAAGQGRAADPYESDRGESDPLAELARLIGQTDPFAAAGQSNAQTPPRALPRQDYRQDLREDQLREDQYGYRQEYPQDDQQEDYQPEAEPEEAPLPASPPSWIQRANLRREAAAREFSVEPQTEIESQHYPSPIHPLHRYTAPPQEAQPDSYYQDEPYQDQQAQDQQARDQEAYAEPEAALDPSRYDDALYGRIESSVQDLQRAPAYPDDPYAYPAGYEEETEEAPAPKRRGPGVMVLGIFALGVFGFAAAYGYHSYFGTVRPGEPPIIKADNSPTKIIPPTDGSAKMPDRLLQGDGAEKIVPREEQPLDVNANTAGPRVVFPQLNQNANPPSLTSVAPNAMPAPPPGSDPAAMAGASNGNLPNSEPRKIKTFSVHGDQPDAAAVPVNVPPPAPPAKQGAVAKPPTQANASANMPLSLVPQARSEPAARTRVASTEPTQIAPSAPAASGGYLVQISSQRNEADAKASFRALQNKFRSVLGSQTPLIKRADLGSKGVYYRAMVGPFGTSEQAAQFCGNLKSAGGQCIIQRN